MHERTHSIVFAVRLLAAGVLVVANLFLLSVLHTTIRTARNHTAHAGSSLYVAGSGSAVDSPNAITNALAAAGSSLSRAWDSLSASVAGTFTNAGNTLRHGSGGIMGSVGSGSLAAIRAVGGAGLGVVHGVGHVFWLAGRGAAIGGRGIGHGTAAAAGFIWRLPQRSYHFIASGTFVTAVIREHDSTPVPVIDSRSPALAAARSALPATPAVTANTPQPLVVPIWPIHGAITTEFGANDWPFEAVHTGIDISDGTRPGTTPVHPFRPGKVVQVIHSGAGLGNHIVIDHGNGVTSVYGHLYSTAVQEGQNVDQSTILGYEGTTGASTGTHLHFEIRVNGQAANPHQFISGRP